MAFEFVHLWYRAMGTMRGDTAALSAVIGFQTRDSSPPQGIWAHIHSVDNALKLVGVRILGQLEPA